jgi:hypothetical protein
LKAGAFKLWINCIGRVQPHLDQAHAAVARDGEALVVAEAGHVHPGLLARLKDRDPLRHVDLLAVDQGCTHSWVSDWLHGPHWLSSAESWFDCKIQR